MKKATVDSLRWYFIEIISQLDIDDLKAEDYANAVVDYKKYYGDIEMTEDEVTKIWNDAHMMVGYP